MASRTGEESTKHLLKALTIAGLLSAATVPVHSADTATTTKRLLVGKTNIYCIQAPCPWRGIAPQGDVRSGPAGLLWSEEGLPGIEATAADASRIKTAWDDGKCLLIDGRLTGSTLQVERIIGACP